MTAPSPRNLKRGSQVAAISAVFLALASVPQASTERPAKRKAAKPAVQRDLSKGNTLYVVPYAHLDTQWRWAYPQVIREYIANTLHDNFKLMDKYPSYVFNFSGSRRYEMMKEYYPADYLRLKGYIKNGQWFPCGSSVDEGDANVPSAESLVRHVLYGNRYFRREFGVASEEFMLPDCFGFPYALPSILAHCGIKGFSTQKLTWGSPVGIPFKVGNWEGPDGKSVVAALDPGSYAADVDEDLSQNTSWLARIQNTGKQSGAYVDYHYYGTGDIGGAPREGSVSWIEKSIAGKGPITVVSSRADEMFKSLTSGQIAKLPRYKGELLLTEHSAGSITSQAAMKRWNRKSELLADAAERASVSAMLLGGATYPSQRLYTAWDLVLGSQMHDMLPGTSIPKAYEFCWNDFLLAQNTFANVEKDAVGAVTSVMDTRAKGVPLVVYNPLSISRRDLVEAWVPITRANASVTVYAADGTALPTQVVARELGRQKVIFLASVPATGFASFDARDTSTVVAKAAVVARGRTLDNGVLQVSINPAGDISSIVEKKTRRQILKAPSQLAMVYHNPSAYPAWNMDWQDAKQAPREYVSGPADIKVVESGPVRGTIQVTRQTNGSKFVQLIRLSAGSGQVDVVNQIDWQTKERALKATFPLTSGNPNATYDLQVGAVERGNNNPGKYEVPQHQWLDLSKADKSYGTAILNDSKFGSDKPDDDTVRLTMIYTPGVRSGFADQATQDFGHHNIVYSIAPHAGDWRKGGVAWSAKRLNQPLAAFVVPAHPGKLGRSFSLFSTNTSQVEISAIKKAEDGNEVIVRLRELEGRPATNVRVTAGMAIRSAREVNGQELPTGKATVQGGALVTTVPGYSLKAFALKLDEPSTVATPVETKSVKLSYNADVVTSDKNLTDGAFDSEGRTLTAEQLPSSLTTDGITFRMGPTRDGAKNAVVARGQTISIPAGFERVYLLAASNAGDVNARFGLGSQREMATVPDWSGYVGQWDNRLWVGNPGPNFTNYGPMGGLVPGFVKGSEIAWYSSHRHHPKAGNEFYSYSYLGKIALDIPKGCTSIMLPNDPRIHVMAVTVAKQVHDQAVAARPLYDDLKANGASGGPAITPASGAFTNATAVRIDPPLYWQRDRLRYTTDGSTPTLSSPAYLSPMMLARPTVLKAAEVAPDGKVGPVTTATLDIRDMTSPSVVEVTSVPTLGMVRVVMSEQLNRTVAENPANYSIPGVSVASIQLASDNQTIELTLEKPLPAGVATNLTVRGIKDLSPTGNPLNVATVPIVERGPVFTQETFVPKTTKVIPVRNLPVKGNQPWTLNLFCKIDEAPDKRVIIAGFGRSVDGQEGTGRYFTNFDAGINFWTANRDVATTEPIEQGKWQMLTASYDGTTMRLYKNGRKIGEKTVQLADDSSQVRVMPFDAWERQRKFNGEVRNLSIWDQPLSPLAVQRLWEQSNK